MNNQFNQGLNALSHSIMTAFGHAIPLLPWSLPCREKEIGLWCACVCVCVSVCVVIAHRHLLRANCGLRAQAGGQHLTLAAGCVASSSTLPCSAQEDFVTTSPLKWGVCVCVCVCVCERERERERERRGGLIRSLLG